MEIIYFLIKEAMFSENPHFLFLDAFYGYLEMKYWSLSISKSLQGATFLGNFVPNPISEQLPNLGFTNSIFLLPPFSSSMHFGHTLDTCIHNLSFSLLMCIFHPLWSLGRSLCSGPSPPSTHSVVCYPSMSALDQLLYFSLWIHQVTKY